MQNVSKVESRIGVWFVLTFDVVISWFDSKLKGFELSC